MKRFAVMLLVVLASVSEATAQEFKVISATPADGTTNVPLETKITFQFSAGIDLNTYFSTTFVREPGNLLRTSNTAVLLDNEERPAVVEFTVSHEPETDYVWLVFDVLSGLDPSVVEPGTPMSEPFVLHYTTASTRGEHAVGGGIVPGEAAAATASVHPHLLKLVERVAASGLGQPVYREETERALLASRRQQRALGIEALGKTAAASTRAQDVAHTVVFLMDYHSIIESSWSIRNATIIEGTSGPYTVEYVRDGSYWPLAVRYVPGTRDIEALGFYDPNGDVAPDSIVVEGASLSNIELKMFSFSRTTAASRLEEARSAASPFGPDQQLVGLTSGYGATPGGLAYTWTYDFFSAEDSLLTSVTLDPLSVFTDTSTISAETEIVPIPDGFVDSDEALAVANEHGGQAFLDLYASTNVMTYMLAGIVGGDTVEERLVWHIEYLTLSDGELQSFSVQVDMLTGMVVTDVEDALEPPGGPGLAQNYPNPFRTSTSIPYTVSQPGHVKLTVYNLVGQEVAVLVDRYQVPGSFVVDWTAAGLPSGSYLCRLEANGHSTTRMLTLLK